MRWDRVVAKYDAFGRKVGEDTLAGIGGTPQRGSSEPVARQAQPTPGAAPASASAPDPARQALTARLEGALSQVAAAQAATQQATTHSAAQRAIPLGRTRKRSSGCLMALVVPIVIAAITLGGGIALVNNSHMHAGHVTIGRVPQQSAPPTGAKSQRVPRGLERGSLVRAASFSAALKKLQQASIGRLTDLRLAPERIDATLLTPGGRLQSVQLSPGGALEKFGGPSGPGFDSNPTIPFARLNPAAPERLARRGAEELRDRTSQLQYLVPTFTSGQLTWAAYFPHSRYVLGDSAGRFQRRYP